MFDFTKLSHSVLLCFQGDKDAGSAPCDQRRSCGDTLPAPSKSPQLSPQPHLVFAGSRALAFVKGERDWHLRRGGEVVIIERSAFFGTFFVIQHCSSYSWFSSHTGMWWCSDRCGEFLQHLLQAAKSPSALWLENSLSALRHLHHHRPGRPHGGHTCSG